MRKSQQLGWRPGHDGVLAEFLADPRLSVAECARRCGYSRWHVSRIRNSPDFQRRYEALRAIALSEAVACRLRFIVEAPEQENN